MANIYRSSEAHQRIADWCDGQYESWAVPHRRHYAPTVLGDSHLVDAGDGPATVLYVCGTNFNPAACLDEIAYLAQHFRVLAVDSPGQPGLGPPIRPVGERFATLGRWLDDVIEYVNEPVYLLGHSMGTAIAFSARHDHIQARVGLNPAGLTRLRVPLPLLVTTMRWLARSTTKNSRKLLTHMCKSGEKPSEIQTQWMALVGKTTRSSLAPPPLKDEVLSPLRESKISLASGRDDVFLPPDQVSTRSQKIWGIDTTAIDSGHLMNRNALDFVIDEIHRLLEQP